MIFRAAVIVLFALALFVILISLVHAAHAGDLPDPKLTPGVADPQLTKDALCKPGFHTGAFRHVTPATKNKVCIEYGLPAHCDAREAYEIDHLIDIADGGANDVRNLWPQSCDPKVRWNCHVKDRLEDRLRVMLCKGQITLPDAQHSISTNWIAEYQKVLGMRALRAKTPYQR